MKVQFNLVGMMGNPVLEPVDLDVLPRVGENVDVPGMPELGVFVRHVDHYPWGSHEGGRTDGPFVYIVLGPKRPE